jgi:hypothetical protein
MGEPGKPTQMTPVGTGQVAAIGMGQLSGDDGGYGRQQADSTDLNPGLEMARAGLEHHTGLMAIGPHPFERGRIGVVQIQQDVTGIPVVSKGLNVDVSALPITNAQESHRRLPAQQGGRPEPFAWEGGSGGVVNHSDQIEIMWHRRELPSNAAQREKQTTIKHKCCRRSDSPYNTLMLYPRGHRRNSFVGNGRCPNSGLSQKGAQARFLKKRATVSEIILHYAVAAGAQTSGSSTVSSFAAVPF